MEPDQDVRDTILLLVNACNDYQIRALTLNSVLRALQLHPAGKRNSLCDCELRAEVLKAYNNAEAIVKHQAKGVVSAFEGSGPFLDVLTQFATRHYLDFEEIAMGMRFDEQGEAGFGRTHH